tara:strand:+ start:378 stop:1214 length:837 start_codon:yes stop_codon:yes gene_type:complete
MATIDLGKIKQVWRGTYSSSNSYTADDLVEYTDNGVTSTYIAVAASSNSNQQVPSTSGTVNSSYWNFVAKGIANPIPAQSSSTNGKVLKSDGTNASWGVGGGMVLLASNTTTGAAVGSITIDNVFSTTYKAYKLYIQDMDFSGNAKLYWRFLDTSGSEISSNNYSWFSFHPYQSSSTATYNIHSASYSGVSYGSFTGDNNAGTAWAIHLEATIFNPMSTTKRPAIIAQSISEEGDRSQMNGHHSFCQFLDTGDCRGIRLFPSSGNVNEWSYQLYGLVS